jgi:hypothetical protein
MNEDDKIKMMMEGELPDTETRAERAARKKALVKEIEKSKDLIAKIIKLEADNKHSQKLSERVERLERICEIQQALIIVLIPTSEREWALDRAISKRIAGRGLINDILKEAAKNETERVCRIPESGQEKTTHTDSANQITLRIRKISPNL